METAYLRIHAAGLDNLPRYRRSQRNSRSSTPKNGSQSNSPLQSPTVDDKRETSAERERKVKGFKEALGSVAAAQGKAAEAEKVKVGGEAGGEGSGK